MFDKGAHLYSANHRRRFESRVQDRRGWCRVTAEKESDHGNEWTTAVAGSFKEERECTLLFQISDTAASVFDERKGDEGENIPSEKES